MRNEYRASSGAAAQGESGAHDGQVVARDPRFAAALVIVAITVSIALGSQFAFQLERAGSSAFFYLSIGPSFAVALLALVRARALGELGTWFRPVWGDFTRGVLGGGIVFTGAYVISRGWAGTPRESWLARLYLQLGDPKFLREHAALMAAIVLVAAAAEEIVWRGLVTRLSAQLVGERWAWAFAAVPYALSQIPTLWVLRDPESGQNPVLVLAALGGGLVWGALVKNVGGRLFPAIVAHAAFLWTVVMAFRLWGVSV